MGEGVRPGGYMSRRKVQWTLDRGVAAISIAAGEGNRIDLEVAQQLCGVAEEIRGDTDVVVVSLLASGRHFCRGGQGGDRQVDWSGALAALAPPIVAGIQGDAENEGAELALLADLRITTPATRFRWAHLHERQLPAAGATQRLPRMVGRMRALDLLLSGRWMKAEEAEQTGLSSRCVSRRSLGAAVAAAARDLAEKGPLALRFAKEAVLAGAEMTFEQGLRLEQDLYVLLQTTEDRREGIESFLEKRKPRFRGR